MSQSESTASEQAKGVVQAVKDKASDVASSLRDMSGNVKEAAVHQYEHARDSAAEYYQAGKDKAVQWQENVEQYVREQPLKSVAIAAGVGVMLGFLWRRL